MRRASRIEPELLSVSPLTGIVESTTAARLASVVTGSFAHAVAASLKPTDTDISDTAMRVESALTEAKRLRDGLASHRLRRSTDSTFRTLEFWEAVVEEPDVLLALP
jgi:hypothetical protein